MNEKMNENVKPLKWHKFMIYFALWARAIFGFCNALFFAGGLHYTNPRTGFPDRSVRDRLYDLFPSIKRIDLAYFVMLIILSLYIIYIRFQLARFRKGAPKKLLSFYMAEFITFLAYVLCYAMVITSQLINLGHPDVAEQVWHFVGESLWNLLPIVIMFFINKKYYDNRKELFVN